MITAEYVRMMARYNAWQNNQIANSLEGLSHKELLQNRGAFFGSILGTLNHLLWGDTIWMSRFDGGEPPAVGIPDSLNMHPTGGAWSAARFQMDGRISLWAKSVRTVDLTGDLTWYSGAIEREITKPRDLLVMQMFNHQTHHRGQVHAMLTAAGVAAPVSDIPFMPE